MAMSPTTPTQPGLPWRMASIAVVGAVSTAVRGFLYGFNTVEVIGMNNLLGVLDRRKAQGRERGLLTACNHVGVLDDPLMWGILPLRYSMDLDNVRWGLGAHDICFKNSFASMFFSLGQVLPTHRLWHSSAGGIYQPTMTQAIAILSGGPTHLRPGLTERSYSSNGSDSFRAPAAYPSNRNAWVHVFPEACCHQNPNSTLRYFKWGISRLILESDPAPEFIPMFIHGTEDIMPEDRKWPRFAPRIGKKVTVVIGEPTDVDRQFGQYRSAWKLLAEKADEATLMHGSEAKQLRVEVAKAVRDEIEQLRVNIGLPPEKDETAALAETWSQEPNKRRFKSPVDGSMVNRH